MPPSPARGVRGNTLVFGLGAVLALCCASLIFGYQAMTPLQMINALTLYEASNAMHVIFVDIRLPRMATAAVAGAALGAAGALLQSMTRNPLADPGILGVNAGAALGVVLSIVILGVTDPARYVWTALTSCLLVSAVVFLIGGRQNTNPTRLLIAGAAVMAVSLAIIRAILLLSRQTLDTYRFWVLGGLDGASFETLAALMPFLAVGCVLAVICSFWLNGLALGEDAAKGLGLRTGLAQVLTACAVVLLCGATVSMVGPVAFVGLVAAHLARPFAQADAKWLLALSAPFGAALLLAADLLGRLPLFGGGMQAGVMSALIGGPVLIWLIWRKGALRQ